jgi:hypothetical protein
MLESVLPLLKEGSTVFLQRYQDKLIGVELPINVDLKVVSTDPGFKGDTVSGATKPAKLETGATIVRRTRLDCPVSSPFMGRCRRSRRWGRGPAGWGLWSVGSAGYE